MVNIMLNKWSGGIPMDKTELTLDAIRDAVREEVKEALEPIKADISKINKNIRIIAKNTGHRYNSKTREIRDFDEKVG